MEPGLGGEGFLLQITAKGRAAGSLTWCGCRGGAWEGAEAGGAGLAQILPWPRAEAQLVLPGWAEGICCHSSGGISASSSPPNRARLDSWWVPGWIAAGCQAGLLLGARQNRGWILACSALPGQVWVPQSWCSPSEIPPPGLCQGLLPSALFGYEIQRILTHS